MKVSDRFVRGFVLGAGIMYLMDPVEGGRRRAFVRDKGVLAWIAGAASRLPATRSGPRPMRYLASALGAVALAYGASRALRERRESQDESIAPNYAYLR